MYKVEDTYYQNPNIKGHILSREKMEAAGFKKPKTESSWLYVEPLTNTADLWVEIWKNDICIEVLDPWRVYPITKNAVISKAFEEKMTEFQELGIISGYDPSVPTFYSRNNEKQKITVSV